MTCTVIISGRLAAAPTSAGTAGGARVTTLLVAASLPAIGPPLQAVTGRRGRSSCLCRIIAFDDVPPGLGTGTPVTIRGRLHATRWTDERGRARRGFEIVAVEVTPGDEPGAPAPP